MTKKTQKELNIFITIILKMIQYLVNNKTAQTFNPVNNLIREEINT